MKIRQSFQLILGLGSAFVVSVSPLHAATPSQADIDQMTADITGSNAAGIDSGVANLRAGIKTGWVSANLWQTWLPALAKDKRYDDVMDLSMLGIENRPETAAIGPILEIRAETLLVGQKRGHKSFYIGRMAYDPFSGLATPSQPNCSIIIRGTGH